jgi:hypothetical protein
MFKTLISEIPQALCTSIIGISGIYTIAKCITPTSLINWYTYFNKETTKPSWYECFYPAKKLEAIHQTLKIIDSIKQKFTETEIISLAPGESDTITVFVTKDIANLLSAKEKKAQLNYTVTHIPEQ